MSIPGQIFALLPSNTFIKDEFLHCNVLYFSMKDVEFIAVTDCKHPSELLQIRNSIAAATKFQCDSRVISAVDHNMAIEQFDDYQAELSNEEWITA